MDSSKDETSLMEITATRASYEDLLESQRELFQNQMEKLQEIVAVQCKLTGVNPLSQEMAAGALSIKIGKRPRDLMNPKAIKYIQSVFSIKDAINKKETREISARFGVTVTQVRDFFNGQRSRVRKLARLSGERVNKSCSSDATNQMSTSNSESNMPVEPIPLSTLAPANVDEGPSCSKSCDISSGMEETDLHFTENIFSYMRKEESFGEQVKLLRWILRIKNPPVLDWFLTEGGLLILATWLSDAAKEEQTTFLKVILKVLHYLPLRHALPGHVSAILQSVNRLRFYRTSDISHRARILLSNWSKIFGKSPSSNKNNGLKSASDLQDEMLLKQSIREVMGNESWDLKDENSEVPLGLLRENPDKLRKMVPAQPIKLLTALGDDTDKRKGDLISFLLHLPRQLPKMRSFVLKLPTDTNDTRERRKVQILEQPGQKSSARNPHVAKSYPATQSRPLSADDIQKAKIRAQFMQSRYGKTITSPIEKVMPESHNRSNSSHDNLPPSVRKSCVDTGINEKRKLYYAETKLADPPETQPPNLEETPKKKCKKDKIPWQTPPELKICEEWHVASGESSKEVEVQNIRIRREREVVYRSEQEIPSDPREPWDREMDHDDSLTPEIPIEQLPDVEPVEPPSVSLGDMQEIAAPIVSTSSAGMAVPDFELLAALLKNPDLVFALTSGQAGNISNEDTVKLLDMIKANGLSLMSNSAGMAGNAGSKSEVSLPSPTPLSHPVPNGLNPDLPRNPFSRQQSLADTNYQSPGAALPLRQGGMALISSGMQPQAAVVAHLTSQPVDSLQTSIQFPGQWQTPSNPLMHHQIGRLNSSNIQHFTTEMKLKGNTGVANTNWAAPSNTGWLEAAVNVRPSTPVMMPPNPPHSPFLQEHIVPNSLRALSGVESNYQYRNNQTMNNYCTHLGGLAEAGVLPAGNCSAQNNVVERLEYESWSPSNSPTRRRHEYLPGQYYNEPRLNLRQGYNRPEGAMKPNVVQPSAYQDPSFTGTGNKTWVDRR